MSDAQVKNAVKSLKRTLRQKIAERDRYEKLAEKELHRFDREINKIKKAVNLLVPKNEKLPKNSARKLDKIRHKVETALGVVELTMGRFYVLRSLIDNGPLSALELAAAVRSEHKVDIPENTVRGNLNVLKKMGLVKYSTQSKTWDAI